MFFPIQGYYCHSGWILIARFSNNDGKNWMIDSGDWWYDRRYSSGATSDPSVNADMISPAFWLLKGRELKITRSDDSSHTPLLQTTANCLVEKHSDQKSQVMATLEMARFGPVTGAWEAVRFNMADSTRQQTGFNRLSAV